MDAKKNTPAATWGKWGSEPGQGKTDYLKDTTAWCLRQLVKIALPWIAGVITSTRFTARKSCFLDRLIIMAEGGGNDTQF
ncbi:MAG: hypothetical protein K9K63_06090 [Desulfotignum sp.]|nr:hypothetical protein [Desulfotignum sp.]MCF8089593.1 hypothetical protein [Desulfotignum sp.]MCF8136865.1 hypothetical protein [Desulfotignum sp.]